MGHRKILPFQAVNHRHTDAHLAVPHILYFYLSIFNSWDFWHWHANSKIDVSNLLISPPKGPWHWQKVNCYIYNIGSYWVLFLKTIDLHALLILLAEGIILQTSWFYQMSPFLLLLRCSAKCQYSAFGSKLYFIMRNSIKPIIVTRIIAPEVSYSLEWFFRFSVIHNIQLKSSF